MDNAILYFLNNLTNKNYYLDLFFIFLSVFFIFFLVVLHFFIFLRKKRIYNWFLAMIVIFFGLVFKEIMSLIYFRVRPFGSLSDINKLIEKSILETSFPSGHTIVAFILAFTLLWIDRKWGIIFIFLASLIGLSRVIVGVHYPTDILAGIFTALLLSLIFKKQIIKN